MEENNKINMPTLAAAIAYTNSHGGGGGGGTSNYNDLSNKPQIGGTTLTGNKSASDLGLVAAVDGKGLSTNDYTDADKAIVGGVTAALAGKQNVLTEGNNIKIDNNTISVNRWAVPAGKVVYTVITSDENYGQNVHVQRHTLGGALIDDRTFLCEMYKTVNVDNLISIYNPYASLNITLLKDSDEHQSGYSYTVNPITTPTSNSFTFMMEQEENDNDLIIREELDAVSSAVSAIKDGQSIDSFADVETALAGKQATLTFDDTPTDGSNNPVKSNGIYDALALKQNATDNNLETTSKTVVGAINEHEGDIGSLMSGLTNVHDGFKAAIGWDNRNNIAAPYKDNWKVNSDGTMSSSGNSDVCVVNVTDGNKYTISFNHSDSEQTGSIIRYYCWNDASDQLISVDSYSYRPQDASYHTFTITAPTTASKLYVTFVNSATNYMVNEGASADEYIQYHPIIGDAVNDHESRIEAVESGDYKVIASVTGDGVKTVAQLLLDLFSSVPSYTKRSSLIYGKAVLPMTEKTTNNAKFGNVSNYQGTTYILTVNIQPSTAYLTEASIASNGTITVTDRSTEVPTNGAVISLVQ